MAASTRLTPVAIHQFFVKLPEPRRRRKRIKHPLLTLVFIALCATLAGADSYEEMARFGVDRRSWLVKYITLSGRMPSADTFGRVLAALDPVAFQKCLLAWVQALHEATDGQLIAIDGKAARAAMARATDKGPLCLVSAWASANHVVLAQLAAPAGSSELGVLPALLELLDLKGAIVTLDALGCQKDIVAQIVAKEGDYVISVKNNQEKLADAVQTALGQAFDGQAEMRQWSQRQTSHGRQELRMYTMMEAPKDFSEREQWPSVRSFGMAVREYVDKSGETRMGVRYYISSLPAKVRLFAEAVRHHWTIENQLHWSMDVSFREDQNRARLDNAQANLGIFRRVALSLLKNTRGLKGSIHCRRQQAAWNEATLETILLGGEVRQD
jgi:predicted transposase YbfD/YdcC